MSDLRPASSPDERAARRAAQQTVAIEALANGASYPEAAAAAGVTSRTIDRWMHVDEFASRLAQRREEAVTRMLGTLSRLAPLALERLGEALTDAERPADAVRAAMFLLTHWARVRQAEELEARLREVEARLGLRPPADVQTVGDVDDEEEAS